jgi:sugar phosphate isomerase/epimerase
VYSLGIVSDEIDRDPARAVAVGSALGITHYELRFLQSGRVPEVDERELILALETCRRNGATVTGLSPGIFKYARTLEDARGELADRFTRSAELAHRLNLNVLIVFGPAKPRAGDTDGPSYRSDDPPAWVLQALHELADAAKRCGVVVALEPEPLSYTDTAIATAKLLASAGRAELLVNYDPGNLAWAQGGDPSDGVALLGSRIANVHVKNLMDAPPDRAPQWSRADEGLIDYAAQFRALASIGYAGPVTLEPHIDGRPITIEAARAAAIRTMEAAFRGGASGAA